MLSNKINRVSRKWVPANTPDGGRAGDVFRCLTWDAIPRCVPDVDRQSVWRDEPAQGRFATSTQSPPGLGSPSSSSWLTPSAFPPAFRFQVSAFQLLASQPDEQCCASMSWCRALCVAPPTARVISRIGLFVHHNSPSEHERRIPCSVSPRGMLRA